MKFALSIAAVGLMTTSLNAQQLFQTTQAQMAAQAPAAAQVQQAQPQPQPAAAMEAAPPAMSVKMLLQNGFQALSTTVLPNSSGFLFTLQRHERLFVCETDTIGMTRACAEVQ